MQDERDGQGKGTGCLVGTKSIKRGARKSSLKEFTKKQSIFSFCAPHSSVPWRFTNRAY